jgi:hypothetical protein
MAGMLASFTMANSKGLYPKMGGARSSTRRKKSSVRTARAAKVARRARPANKRARMVKGSRAAKAYMAKIRRKRR